MSGTLQYKRLAQLLVGTVSGATSGPAVDLSTLRFTFQFEKSTFNRSGVGIVKVYNIAATTAAQIPNPFTPSQGGAIVIKTGWQGFAPEPLPSMYGVLFAGTVVQKNIGRESNVDSYMELVCHGGDLAMVAAVNNRTLAAGWQQKDAWGVSALAMAEQALGFGTVGGTPSPAPSNLPQTHAPRGKSMFGKSANHLHNMGRDNGFDWWLEAGILQSTPWTEVAPQLAIELNATSGMIGTPTVTSYGIVIKALVNANFRITGRVQIVPIAGLPMGVVPATISPELGAVPIEAIFDKSVSPSGSYKIMGIRHIGDTRGNDWYSELTCWPTDVVGPFNTPTFGVAM